MSNLVAEFLVLFTYVNVGEVNKSNAFPLCFSKEYRLLSISNIWNANSVKEIDRWGYVMF